MFKSGLWRSEKNKVKVVFKLQFRAAAQIPQIGAETLMVSLVPADTGKATVRSDKAVVRDGSCFWENPVFETVKFNREPKSGKIQEKIYYFVVGTGSSKAGNVGEASIDFSSYAESTKVSSVSLPLKNSKAEAVLHVSIQRIHEPNDQREVEESENVKQNSKDHSLRTQLSNSDIDETIKASSVEDILFNKELIGNRRASSGSDLTLSSSESSSGVEIPWEPQTKNGNVQQEPDGFLSSAKPQGPKPDVPTAIYEGNHRSQWEWLGNSALEASTDDSSSTPRETILTHHSDEASDIVIEKLKTEVAALSRQAEMSELELQTLRKQIVKESKRGQDLCKEVVCLKEERDALKGECEKLKASSQRRTSDGKLKSNMHFEGGDSQAMVEELRQELNHAKELNANLQIQLQKTQESNSELILAVQDLDEMLEQKNRETLNISSESSTKEDEKLRETGSIYQPDDDNDDEEQKALEELVKEHSDAKEAYLLEQQIMDLRSEIEIYKRDRDELEMQMEQLALDYEIIKQENHDMSYRLEQSQIQEQLKFQYECTPSFTVHELESQMENLEDELKERSKESDDSLVMIRELEAHVKSLEEELEKQAEGFEADLEALTRSKVEQEQRAIRAEETLRKTRWQNANTAERLQEEFRRLSVQMTSTFEANEKLAAKALAEANELRFQKHHLEQMLQEKSEEHQSVKDDYEARLHELTSQVTFMTYEIEQMHSEIEDRAVELEHQKKHAEESQRSLSDEILKREEEIETYKAKNIILSEEKGDKETLVHDLAKMRITMKEMELLLEQGNDERVKLESRVLLLKSETEESREELNNLRCFVEEKELVVGNLQSKLDTLQSLCTELKQSLSEDELEKEKLRKQVSQLKSELKKKEDALNSMEKKMKDGAARGAALDAIKAASKTGKPLPRGSKEVANLKERIKVLEGHIKLKETALETSTNTFLEKEKDLHDKIVELEERLEMLNQSSTQYLENEAKKVADCRFCESTRINNENLSSSVKELTSNTEKQYELIKELALLKEKNVSMDEELKEMQERYSEISLKFAEVEGERQQLVMKVRYLKNAKKSS